MRAYPVEHRDARVRRVVPLPQSVNVWKTRAILEQVARERRDVPLVVIRERRHLLDIARREGIAVDVAGTCDQQQGYAFRSRRRVEVSPLVTLFASTLAHELGHALDPSRAGRVRRELNAWKWARAHMLTWNGDCDENRRWALNSYRPYATVSEQREIDLLCKGA